eukprot:c8643_g1_i1.p1 GENE.c8643_g1_i1~~c8643_g1_i1.p1  ORF type:complete len:486 (+),score=81.84 c8643_g1_i1:72-1460(+)
MEETTAIEQKLIEKPQEVSQHAHRFYFLFVFSLLCFNQVLFWITFSPISEHTSDYFSIPSSQVELLLNYGPIFYFVAIPFVMVLSDQRNGGGLRICVVSAAVLQGICVVLRVICVETRKQHEYVWLVHIAQIANGASGPLVLATPAQMAETWFAGKERTIAACLAIASSSIGAAVGYLLGPHLVTSTSSLPNLLYTHLAVGIVALVLAVIYFPNRPNDVGIITPSISSDYPMRSGKRPRAFSSEPVRIFVGGIRKSLHHPQFLILACSGGLINGVYIAYLGLLVEILRPKGFTDTQAGWVSFSATVGGIIGTISVGFISSRWFAGRYQQLLIAMLCGATASVLLVTLSLPSILWHSDSYSPLPTTLGVLFGAFVFSGYCIGSTLPLCFELVVEMTYNIIPEGTAGAILTTFLSLGSALFLIIPPSISVAMNVVMLFCLLASIAAIATVRVRYRRFETTVGSC